MKNNYVAIVGRPNVGKSTLFNRLIQKRIAITSEQEGTTRDRILHKVSWLKRDFYLMDTGGWNSNLKINFQEDINKQVEIAIDYASVILFVVSFKEGVIKEDLIIASKLKKLTNKKVLLVVNKTDNKESFQLMAQFYQFGIKDVIGVSSIHGFGITDLLDSVANNLPKESSSINSSMKRIGIIGKPNVGKSSLINLLLNDERVIVSAKPGTTRDAIDTQFTWNGKIYILTDTAGIKRNKDSLSDIEFFSELRSNLTIKSSDIAVLLLDYTQEFTHVDENLVDILRQENKPAVLVVNKSDLIKEKDRKNIELDLQGKFKFAAYYPVIFISVKQKKNILKIFEWVEKISEELQQEINKERLNKFLRDIQVIKAPPRHNGMLLKMTYITYSNISFPHFIVFMNKPDYLHFSYKRFLENQIRKVFNFEGIPIKISYREKGE